jgi:cytochrome c553
MRRGVIVVLLSGSLTAASLTAVAQTAKSPPPPQATSKAGDTDKTPKPAAAAAGRKAAEFCANCHGEDGNSTASDVPNLAGQNRAYLLTQMQKYVSGERKNRFKEGLIRLLPPADLPLLATYYADSSVKPTAKEPDASADQGRKLYQRLCANCHGPTALGSETLPRLAGQQTDYLRVSLMRYRANTGERVFAPMSAVTAGLSEPDIMALAAYLGRLR